MPRKLLCLSLICLTLFMVTGLSSAAVSPVVTLADKPEKTAEKTAAAQVLVSKLTDTEIDTIRAQLDAKATEIRLKAGPDAIALLRNTYQDTATPEELDEWENLTRKLASILEEHAISLFRYKESRKATHDKVEESKSWQGFTEKPPFSLLLVDSLRDNLEAKKSVLKSVDLIIETIEADFKEYSNNLKNSSKLIRLADEGVEKNAGKEGELRSKWLLTLAQLNKEVNQSGVVYCETRRISAAEIQKKIQVEIDFISKKLAIAKGNYSFTAEELKQKIHFIDDTIDTTKKFLDQAKDDEKFSRRQLDTIDAAVKSANAKIAAGGRSHLQLEMLLRKQKQQWIIFEDATIRATVSSGIMHLLKNEKAVWEHRFSIAAGENISAIRTELKDKNNEIETVNKWKQYVATRLNSIQLGIKTQQEALAASLSASDSEDIRSIITIYRNEADLLQRGVLFMDNYEQLVSRRDEELQEQQKTLTGRASGLLDTVSSLISKVWFTELYVAEETIIVDDRKISRPRSVTIGKVVQAVLILLVGMWGIRHLKKLIHWFSTNRLKLDANDAQLYSRLLTYLLFIIVLVSALVFVNIPLAVFTFFGGALAIGIGFGAQALIGNFISGLILMFDRTIRVEDMVEVDGHRGRVAAIGMRSSSVKRFDGVEMLVPNSLFLQQNVINWTSSDPRARYTVSVGVAYGSPTKIVDRIILLAVEAQPEVLRDPAPYVVFDSFGDSSLNFTAYFWIEQDPGVNTLIVFSDIRHRIGERLADAGISIPFPQRDLHLLADKPLDFRVVRDE